MLTSFPQLHNSFLQLPTEDRLTKEEAKTIREVLADLALILHQLQALQDLDAGTERAMASLAESVHSISTQLNIFLPVYSVSS